MTDFLSESYWDSRYAEGATGWDLKGVSRPLREYIDQLKDKSTRILVPGAGYGYEVQYLWEKGFVNTVVVDLSKVALSDLKKRIPSFPESQLMHDNFFNLTGSFDLILEQTFFCALHPDLRQQYTRKMSNLLEPSGKLVGLLFNFSLTEKGPPFGGSMEEYKSLFESYFTIKTLEPCYNSALSRKGKELFLILLKET